MKRLRVERDGLAWAVRAAATQRAHVADWSYFSSWCRKAGRKELPASAETVELWVTHELGRGLRCTTVQRYVCSVAFMHRFKGHTSPVCPGVAALLSGARRIRKEQPVAKAALTPEELRQISRALGRDALSVRDRAVMVFGFASAMRRSELAALDLADVGFGKKGLEIRIRTSKRDQEGKGRSIGIFPGRRAARCPVRALKGWLRVRGKWDGPLFCRVEPRKLSVDRRAINGQSVNQAVKRCVRLIGLDPAKYGGHSVRAGCVTAAIATGCSELAIMHRTGHKSVTTLRRYVRPKAFAFDPLAKAL